jgi:hypothetical protein
MGVRNDHLACITLEKRFLSRLPIKPYKKRKNHRNKFKNGPLVIKYSFLL